MRTVENASCDGNGCNAERSGTPRNVRAGTQVRAMERTAEYDHVFSPSIKRDLIMSRNGHSHGPLSVKNEIFTLHRTLNRFSIRPQEIELDPTKKSLPNNNIISNRFFNLFIPILIKKKNVKFCLFCFRPLYSQYL